MSYAAQCMMCKYAQWRGNHVRGCLRFEETQGPPDLTLVLQALLYQLAADRPCVARHALPVHKDAYFAQDLPDVD